MTPIRNFWLVLGCEEGMVKETLTLVSRMQRQVLLGHELLQRLCPEGRCSAIVYRLTLVFRVATVRCIYYQLQMESISVHKNFDKTL